MRRARFPLFPINVRSGDGRRITAARITGFPIPVYDLATREEVGEIDGVVILAYAYEVWVDGVGQLNRSACGRIDNDGPLYGEVELDDITTLDTGDDTGDEFEVDMIGAVARVAIGDRPAFPGRPITLGVNL